MKPYTPIRPNGGNMYHIGSTPEQYKADGFYQPGPHEETDRRRLAVKPFVAVELPAAELDLQVYQEWVELDWKAPHGTYQAVERLRDKIWEEAGNELLEVTADLDDPVELLAKQGSTKYMDEAGDALWCTVAVASNAGVNITEAVRIYQRDWYLHPDPTGPISFGDVEAKLVDHIPTGLVQPGYLSADSRDIDHIPNVQSHMKYFGRGAGNVLDRQFGYNERLDASLLQQYLVEASEVAGAAAKAMLADWAQQVSDFEQNSLIRKEVEASILESHYRHIGRTIVRPIIGDSLIFQAYLAKRHGVSLADIAVNNIHKITGRVATQTVDKTDNERPS